MKYKEEAQILLQIRDKVLKDYIKLENETFRKQKTKRVKNILTAYKRLEKGLVSSWSYLDDLNFELQGEEDEQ